MLLSHRIEKKDLPEFYRKKFEIKAILERTLVEILNSLKQKIQIKQASKKYTAIAKDDRAATQLSNNPVARQIQACQLPRAQESLLEDP